MFGRSFPLAWLLVAILCSPSAAVAQSQGGTELEPAALNRFEASIEQLRLKLATPSFAAGIVKDGKLVWGRGFGYADVENKVVPDVHTPYHLASLTKTFAATILLQLADEGQVGLDDPVAEYGLELPSDGVVTVRHLFSHTSEDPPGRYYRYNGARFGRLDWVIRSVTGRSYGDLLEERIVRPLKLSDTSPSNYAENYESVLSRLARPYEVGESGKPEPGEYPTYFGTAAGLVSSVADVAEHATAVAEGRLIEPETRDLAFTPTLSTTGERLPYGLGWFTQEFLGAPLVWHYGYWNCNSSLIITVPQQRLTFIILTNTDALSRGFGLGYGDVLASPAAIAFLETFVAPAILGEPVPQIDWAADEAALAENLSSLGNSNLAGLAKSELMAEWSIHNARGDHEAAERLYRVHSRVFARSRWAELSEREPLVLIDGVGNREDRTEEFTLDADGRYRIFAVGELMPYQVFDYGWIEEAESGEVVWRMDASNTVHAGGGPSNARVDQTVSLMAGSYRLRYRSDGGHAYGQWNVFPPDDQFWGIAIFSE